MLEREVPRLVLLRHLGRPSRSQLVTPALFVMMNTTGLNYYLSVRDPAAAGLPSTAYTCAEVFPVSLSVCPPATVFQMDLHSLRRGDGTSGAMSSSGGAFRAAEAFVKSFVIDGDSVTFDRTALEGLRVRSSTVPSPCPARVTRADQRSHLSLPTRPLAQDFELSPGRCVCVFPVRPRVQNRYGTLHGGCVATLVDVVSTVALLTVSKDPGVRYVHF